MDENKEGIFWQIYSVCFVLLLGKAREVRFWKDPPLSKTQYIVKTLDSYLKTTNTSLIEALESVWPFDWSLFTFNSKETRKKWESFLLDSADIGYPLKGTSPLGWIISLLFVTKKGLGKNDLLSKSMNSMNHWSQFLLKF